jgi:beta-N-acetylhexosaminidase
VTQPILGRVMLAFEGESVPPRIERRLAEAPAAGVTLFRAHNIRTPGQVLELTSALQRAAGSLLLIGADQEGGQLIGLGDATTPFAGNMALGAVDDLELTERVGHAIGLEARAIGVNLVYAPSLDLATNPANPAIGIRAFGDRPAHVARHGTALLRGLQSAGVAGTVKHFPGIGDLAADTHHGLAGIDQPRSVLDARELVPFRAAFGAGGNVAPRLAMSGHVALPAVSGRDDLPATLSRAVMTDLLRRDLGFDGLSISDALDMGAITGAAYGAGADGGVPDVVAALNAGVDLLLASADAAALERIEDALVKAVEAGAIDPAEVASAELRLATLREWLARFGAPPDLGVVGSSDHAELAAELAARSITFVRDSHGVLPIPRGSVDGRILAVMPSPADLTPADTSSLVAPGLAECLRADHADVEECVVEQRPDQRAIAAVRDRAREAAFVVIGTIDGHRQPEQLAVVEALAGVGVPIVAVALRGPWDVRGYPPNAAVFATYSILSPSLVALADVLAGRASATGRFPVTLST